MSGFELRRECNLLLDKLNQTIGKKNILKLNIDVGLPDKFAGDPEHFHSIIERLAGFIDACLVNGIILIEVNSYAHHNAHHKLHVQLAGQGTNRLKTSDKAKLNMIMRDLNISLVDKTTPDEIRLEFTYEVEAVDLPTHSSSLLAGKQILLAEDNEINAMVFASFLEEWGCLTTVAINGAEAVSLAHEKEFDAILMDIFMPILSGHQATAKIREFNTSIPIIALTASTREENVREAMQAGTNDYLLKPVSSAELYRVLSKYL